jgi:hypothetical protein
MIWCLPCLLSRYRLRVIKVLLLLPLTILLPACVQLSPAGAQVKVVKKEQAATLSTCQSLGQVSVSSEDALRNAAAALSGDTALMTLRETNGSFYIRGTVYRCASAAPLAPNTLRPAPAPETMAAPVDASEALRKTAKCRDKGGAWDGHQCIIEIE